MHIFKRKKLHVWEYEPYAFERGKVYVMEVNMLDISAAELANLRGYYSHYNITMHIVPTRGNTRSLHPVEVRREKEEL